MRVMLFAKAPRLGMVKTRLARDIGDARALDVYRSVGHHVAAAVAAEYPVTVWYDPPDAEPEMRSWLGDYECREQVGRDLGERMARAFREHFARGEHPVVAIGADAPAVSAQTIADAEALLRGADVVIGPAHDGGYYLLGSDRPHDDLFRDVPWGSADVLGITVRHCADLHLSVGLLEVQRDIDTVEDLRALELDYT